MKQKAKPDYKKTKLGWIPEEWSILEFDEIAIRSKSTYSNKKDNKSYKCIELEHINQNVGTINGYANSLAQKSTKTRFESGQILFGKLRPYLKKFWLADFNGVCSTEIWVLDGREGMSENNFLFYLIQSNRFIQTANATSGSKMPRADWWYVSKFPFILPPLPEQQKIAHILNTWDKAIAAQEQLIAQKRELKKGLMQVLLTGKKRFDGFTEEWKEVKLKDIANFRRGSFPQPYGLAKWYDDDNGMPFVQVYDVADNMRLKTKTKRKISALAQDQSVFVKKGTVVLTIQGSIGRIAITQYDAYVDRTLLIFQDYKFPVETVFFTYVVELLFEKEKQIAPGGTIKTITKEKLSNFKLLLPPLEEQRLISKTLTAFEKEITNLKKVLLSTKQQKQGLMQQLLTGEKRVTKNE